jgi:hypothetical protein
MQCVMDGGISQLLLVQFGIAMFMLKMIVAFVGH